MNSGATCADCGTSREGVPDGEPCSSCGSSRLAYQLTVFGSGEGIGSVFSLQADRPSVPGWEVLWAQIERRIKRLRSMYLPGSGTLHYEMEDETDALLTACNHLFDWLKHDPSVAQAGLRSNKLSRYREKQSTALGLCSDYANSFKHHTLQQYQDKPPRRYVRLTRVINTATGNTIKARIWTYGDDVSDYIDALELAEQSVAAWRTLLSQYPALAARLQALDEQNA
jgi:hypothetical protein